MGLSSSPAHFPSSFFPKQHSPKSVETRLVKITESPSKTLATIEIHNLQGKGLKSFKAMLVLKDATGKDVDVQSRWLYGATPDEKAPAILANNKKTDV